MATIRRFANCTIAIYADDHLLPHFHIEGRGVRAIVEIETMVVRAGDARRAAEAMAWAAANKRLLWSAWARLARKDRAWTPKPRTSALFAPAPAAR
ncbi:DUF4160 domain-containing protein [Methylosinus sp. Sm6]|uniref:DUF4160 domain-containing protein n=1 Tax=Methylosinus sp. Sm6 TaxID=2866948 RepID=UPI001C99D20A|nr:DUF4160 domain-containing protein [Methylosinus sp. Sm6]MBY6239727.1 DUF4160 domain-containing protein [Methylosinus sp. Sm6]